MPITANGAGILTGSFAIPANVPAGTKRVEFVGAAGSRGTGQFIGRGELLVQRWSRVTTIETALFFDPLAQTFSLTRGRHVTGVDVRFTAKGTSGSPVTVQIREVENGIPTRTALADATVPAASISTTATWTRATFGTPVFLEADREYAVVLLTDDPNHAVAVAELGKFDAVAQKWVTRQPYTIGVLLSSSNASTWTAHQEKDLAFRLIGAAFSSTTRTVSLGNLSASNASDVLPVAPIDRPTAATNLLLRYTRSNGTVYELQPGQALPFDARVTDTVAVEALLSGNTFESPVLFPGTQTVLGNLDESATYVTRQIPAGNSKTIKVTFDAVLPGSAAVAVEYETSTPGAFAAISSPTAVQLGDGLVEYTYSSGTVSVPNTRIRLTLTGNTAHRPRVRNLRVVVV